MQIINQLRNELINFWDWAEMDFNEYEKLKQNTAFDETMYPRWDKLISLTKETILAMKKNSTDKNILETILEVMALDNETESLLDFCDVELDPIEQELLISASISFSLSGARWQIAELIGRKKNKKWKQYVLSLTNDSNNYVRRRALLSLVKLDSELASNIAYQNLRDQDDMLRLVSLRILIETSSDLLKEAIQILQDDHFHFIREEVNKIINRREKH